jgi:DNA adenine methylase
VADVNTELIECFAAIRRNHHAVLKELLRLKKSKGRYLWARDSWHPSTPSARAARFLFLLRHSWNGIYRVNRKGHFNVPYSPRGFKSQPDEQGFAAAAAVLRRVRIVVQDFSATIANATAGDFIFADPPYFSSGRDTFRRYHSAPFDESRQVRLAHELRQAERRGADWVLTNGCSEQIERYWPDYECFAVPRASTLAASSAARRTIEEYLVLSRSRRLDPLRSALSAPFSF